MAQKERELIGERTRAALAAARARGDTWAVTGVIGPPGGRTAARLHLRGDRPTTW